MSKSKIPARHISHSFYELSPEEAKSLCVDGRLPAPGYAKKAHPPLQIMERLALDDNQKFKLKEGWIQTTRHWGKTVWAIHLTYDL